MHLGLLPRVIERVAGKFFFSPLVSSRGIRDDIEEEDEQVSDPTISLPLPQEPLGLNLYPFFHFLSSAFYHVHVTLHIQSLQVGFVECSEKPRSNIYMLNNPPPHPTHRFKNC